MERRLWLLSWKELKDVTRKVRFVALPIGVVEAHGPHLPLGTDFIIPNYLSTVLVEKLNGLLAPPIPYGVTTSLTGFPGCLSIEPETLRRLVFEVLRSLRRSGFDK
ncbi:MAG TPA: creatininase family protein, partial [Candidatus Korarchaeota archaeon]|nr:creatininase family protein [Candidatus Korarchaeota archaeon]